SAARVYCWGNDAGRPTGSDPVNCIDLSSTNQYHPQTWPCTPVPQMVKMDDGSPISAAQVDVGYGHARVGTTSSDGICWGSNAYGQVGAFILATGGTQTYPAVMNPIPVEGGLKFYWIATGGNSTCGAATTGFFCWGDIGRMITGNPYNSSSLPL